MKWDQLDQRQLVVEILMRVKLNSCEWPRSAPNIYLDLCSFIQLAELESGEAHLHEWLSRLGQAAPKPKPPQPLKFVYLN